MGSEYRLMDFVVERGQCHRGWLPLLEMSDGTHLKVAVSIIHGQHPGETIYIGAGAHGDEVTTILAAVNVLADLDPKQIHGTIVVVPVQNAYGYQTRKRLIHINESDSDTLNLHRVFPGNPQGDMHQRMADKLYRLMTESGATFFFDLHTGFSGSYCPPHTFVPPDTLGKAAEEALEAAKVFNAGFIVQARGGVYAHGGMPHTVLGQLGLPVLGTELGQGGFPNPEFIELGRQGILNVLRLRGVLQDGQPVTPVKQPLLREVVYVRANRGGLFEHLVRAGSFVEKDQPIARVRSLFGDTVETIVSPTAGFIITAMSWATIYQGERVCRIGVPDPEPA